MKSCDHRNSWVIGGGSGLWCYVCGAYRGMENAYGRGMIPRTVWIKPTGNRDNNPSEKLKYKVRKLKE